MAWFVTVVVILGIASWVISGFITDKQNKK
jgi:hypothetical protein